MCRTVHSTIETALCGIHMLLRVFMTMILMVENIIRMFLQTIYNFISFVLQVVSLIPICLVFMLTSRLKCFMCGGGGPCPVNRGGACDCIMSAVAFILLFFIFRATGVLDKIFYGLGYAKARPLADIKFVPTPGEITECSRSNDTHAIFHDTDTIFNDTDTNFTTVVMNMGRPTTGDDRTWRPINTPPVGDKGTSDRHPGWHRPPPEDRRLGARQDHSEITNEATKPMKSTTTESMRSTTTEPMRWTTTESEPNLEGNTTTTPFPFKSIERLGAGQDYSETTNWTTVLYYIL